jgi:hypothetical protein
VPVVLKSGSLNLLEPSGPVQACNGIALPFALLQLYISFKTSKHVFLHFNAIKYAKPLEKMANGKTPTLPNISKTARILEIKKNRSCPGENWTYGSPILLCKYKFTNSKLKRKYKFTNLKLKRKYKFTNSKLKRKKCEVQTLFLKQKFAINFFVFTWKQQIEVFTTTIRRARNSCLTPNSYYFLWHVQQMQYNSLL